MFARMETNMVSCPIAEEAAIISSNFYQLPLNIDRVCRICLNENSTLLSIFDPNEEADFSKKIQVCGSIEIEVQDGLPSLICNVCRYKVNVAQEFRDLCQQSDAKLRLLYNKPAKSKFMDEATQTEAQNRIIMTKGQVNGHDDYFVKQEPQILNSQIAQVVYGADNLIADLEIISRSEEKMFFGNINLETSKPDDVCAQPQVIEDELKDKLPVDIIEPILETDNFTTNPEVQVQKRVSSRKTKSVSRCTDFSDTETEGLFSKLNQKGMKKNLSAHEKKHGCDVCSKTFHKVENLERHKKTHHGGENLGSKEIDNEDNEESEASKQSELYKCEMCGQCCSSLKNLKRHALIHGEKKYSCTVCDKWFFRPDTLKKHAEKHGHGLLDNLDVDNKLYDSDNEPFLNSQEVEKKKEESEEEGTTGEYKCQHCDKVMATKKGLRRHVSMHKPKAEPVTCEICKKVCASQARLALHQKTHNKPKERPPREYLCHICSKVYPSNSSLTYHMRTHTGIKPHVCKTCNSGFTTTTSLANHIRIHTGDRPFVCHVCSAAFAVSSAFRRHLTRHTGEANYLCKTCGKAFKRLSTLKEHTYTHSGEKPYVCKTCGAAYSHSGSLFAHQKRCRAQYSEMVVEDHRNVTPHIHVNNLQTAVRSLAVIGQMY